MRLRAWIACAGVLVAAGCAAILADDQYNAQSLVTLKQSFAPKGQATLDRLDQDQTQELCTRYAATALPKDVAARIEAANLAGIQYPADEDYLGDWKRGEKIAQTGVGKQSSDDPSKPGGGNCYACHQLSKAEIAYGTIGPSLYQYGKTRGNGEAVVKYTWGKLYNADAFVACSNMPRFGHKGILTQEQLKDLMALLLDPASAVNQ
jgi:L-cysteine S-thiosulfotransferase